jgi:hypothetical protein
VDGKYNPPDLATPLQVDNITQVTIPSVDVLWVIDNSCSMEEEQTALRNSFSDFMHYFTDSGLDYHVGVVSTDMDARQQSGKLQEDDSGDGSRYIDTSYSADQAVESFRQRANLGTGGSSEERGKDAAWGALVDEANATNAGFYRDDASLSIVVISDERDQSHTSQNEFISWMENLKTGDAVATFSSIVGPEPNGCRTAEVGRGYLEVTEAVGGIEWSICTDDWSGLLTELGLQAAGLRREFFLSLVPVEDTIQVTVDADGTAETFEAGTDWTYSRTRNSVTFADYVPDPLSVVSIQYEVLASAQDPAADTQATSASGE